MLASLLGHAFGSRLRDAAFCVPGAGLGACEAPVPGAAVVQEHRLSAVTLIWVQAPSLPKLLAVAGRHTAPLPRALPAA